jgi:hypothetical protein
MAGKIPDLSKYSDEQLKAIIDGADQRVDPVDPVDPDMSGKSDAELQDIINFSSISEEMSPQNLSIARSKNNPLGNFLRKQAEQPRPDESETDRSSRLYGKISAPKQSESNPLWSGFDHFGSGYLQGTGDELKAATAAAKESLGGGLPLGEAYNQALPQYQGAREAYRKENPKLAPALEMGGAVAPWLLGSRLIPPGPMGQLAGWGSKAWHGLKIGAPAGAMTGALMAEGGAFDRLKGGAEGMAYGGLFGGAAPLAVSAVSAAGKSLINQLVSRLPFQQKSMAARKVAEALDRDGLTIDQAAAKLKDMGPNASILDLGPNARALAGSAQQTPGKGKTAITDFLVDRQEGVRDPGQVITGGQIGRIENQIDNLVPGNFADAKAGFATARKSFGRAYDAARDGGDLVDIAPLLQNLDKEIEVSKGGIKSALQSIRALVVDKKGYPEITIETLHQAKMAIDDLMSGAARSSMGNVAKGRVRAYQNSLLDAIESSGESGAAYRGGRAGTRGEWLKDEALESGANFIRSAEFKKPQVLDIALSEMSPEELNAFRIGAAQALKQEIGGRTNVRQDAVKKIMDMPDLEKKIRAAFGDPELFKRYITGLQGESEMFKGYAMMGGSPTAAREAAKKDAAIDPSRILQGLTQMKYGSATGNPMDMLGGAINMAGGAKDRILMPEKMSGALGETLTGRSMKSLRTPYQAVEARKKLLEALSRAAAAGAGSQGQTMKRALIGDE